MPAKFDEEATSLIRGEFQTDGKTFVVRLSDTPISGVGSNPQEAFDALMRAKDAAGDLPRQLRALAQEQRGEAVRVAVVRTTMAALIAFGVVGGALAGAATLAPGLLAEVVGATADRLAAMPPETEQKLSDLLHRFDSRTDCGPGVMPDEASADTTL